LRGALVVAFRTGPARPAAGSLRRGLTAALTRPLGTIGSVTEPTRTRLYLVRHCDVRNPKGVLYGHLPNFPLSERGVGQAHALGRFFAGRPIRRIYTSPL